MKAASLLWLRFSAIILIAAFVVVRPALAQEQAPADSTEQVSDEAQDTDHQEEADQGEAVDSHDEQGPLPPIWMVLPFVAILLMIATGPLFYAHHWHHHYPKYAVGFGLVVAAYYIFVLDTVVPIEHAVSEYLSFIALVASLFVAASGVFLSMNLKGTPGNNIILLFIASVVANLIATTGAAIAM